MCTKAKTICMKSSWLEWNTFILFPIKHAQLYLGVILSILEDSHDAFTHIPQGCFTGTGAILWYGSVVWRYFSVTGGVSLMFCELFKTFSRNLCFAKIIVLMRIPSWNFVCMPKAMLWKFQPEIFTINVISGTVYFREVILESLRSVSKQPPGANILALNQNICFQFCILDIFTSLISCSLYSVGGDDSVLIKPNNILMAFLVILPYINAIWMSHKNCSICLLISICWLWMF